MGHQGIVADDHRHVGIAPHVAAGVPPTHARRADGDLGGLVDGTGRSTMMERLAFLFGALVVPPLLVPLYTSVDTQITTNPVIIIAAGLLVGIGTRLANGCTSGHGVCGISRLAPRGLASTGLYLLGGAVTILVFRHGLELI